MKKYLIFMLISMSATIVAQTELPELDGRKAYKTKFVMPDLSVQNIALIVNDSDKVKFLKIVESNKWNIQPIPLKEKLLHKGDYLICKGEPLLEASEIYRFLANQLCEACSDAKVFDKTTGAILLLQNTDGTKNLVEVYWLTKLKEWCMNVHSFVNDNFTFEAKGDRKIFYL